MPPEPQRQRVGQDVVPAGVGGQPPRLGHHVTVEEHQDAAAGGLRPGVAGSGQAEPQIFLVDHPEVQTRAFGALQRSLRSVVDDDHLEQITRVGLPGQRRQSQL